MTVSTNISSAHAYQRTRGGMHPLPVLDSEQGSDLYFLTSDTEYMRSDVTTVHNKYIIGVGKHLTPSK
jgi:hypothetical protein